MTKRNVFCYKFNHENCTMKKLLYISGIACLLLAASCASDKKEDDPQAPSPTTDGRDQFVAYWNVNENSAAAGPNNYTVNIVKSQVNANEVLMNNFYGIPGSSVRASVSGISLNIPYQSVPSGFVIGGKGTLVNSNKITMTYTAQLGTNRDSCTADYTK